MKQLFAMVSSKREPFYFECVYNLRGRFNYRPALLHLPERGKSRMQLIRDMFGPGHSPLVSGAFFVLGVSPGSAFRFAPDEMVCPAQKPAWN